MSAVTPTPEEASALCLFLGLAIPPRDVLPPVEVDARTWRLLYGFTERVRLALPRKG